VIEAWRTNPGLIELAREMQNTQVFLRMAAIELRRLADNAPDIAAELSHVALKLEAEAEDLVRIIESRPDPALDAEA
jgi:hypothetical protein